MEYVKTGTLTCHASSLANIDKQIGFVPAYVKVWNPANGVSLEWQYGMTAGTAMKFGGYTSGALTSAGLKIGTTPANVASNAFGFRVLGVDYSVAAVAAGTAPTATTIPQNKWGLFGWEVGINGTIDKVDAAGNAAGYASEALAIAAAPAASAGHIRLGYVTVMRTNAAGFVGATTSFADAETTATYYSYPTMMQQATLGITPIDDSTTGQGFRVGIDTDLQVLGATLYYRAWR